MMNTLVSNTEKSAFLQALENNMAKGGVVQYERIQITPAIATEMLTKISPDNRRKLNDKIVKEYADAMAKGAWPYNSMPIVFDEKGLLIDGIQRLNAIISSGVTLDVLVAFNVPEDTLHTIDQHRRRTFSGILESRGILQAGTVIRLMSTMIRIENGELGIETYPIGWGRYSEVLKSNPNLQTAVKLATDTSQRGNALASSPRTALAFMAIEAGQREKLEVFMKALKEDDVVAPDSPALMLRNQLETTRRNAKNNKAVGYSDVEQLALGILAFNDFVEDVSVTRSYKWVPKYKKPGGNIADKSIRSELRELAPANLGLPKMIGYPGIKNAKIDMGRKEVNLMSGELQELLEKGARKNTGNSETKMVLVTPEWADQLLKRFNTKNRRIQAGHVDMMARDMKNSRWMVNVQPICFTGDPMSYHYDDEPVRKDGDMRLLNGQHRLMACVKSGIPIEIPIATNVPEEAFATYDQQARKGQSGMIGKEGLKVDARAAVAAARLQWRLDQDYDPTQKGTNPTQSEIEETLVRHPDLTDGALESRDLALLELASGGIILFLVYHVRQDRPELAEEFIEFMKTGIYGDEHPMISIRSKLYGKRREVHRLEVLKKLLEAWEAHKKYSDDKKKPSKSEVANEQEAFL